MRLVRLPGVYRPRSDSRLLLRALLESPSPTAGRSVLDLCTGTGVLAVAAARAGADVLAVDVSRRAIANVRLNARLNGVRLRAVTGDLWAPVRGRRFDVVVSNPPYLPGAAAPRGAARAWDAGDDGRVLLDRICADAVHHLRPGGRLLLVQSSLADVGRTERALEMAGLSVRPVVQQDGPLGPLGAARRDRHGQDRETLAVLEALAPGPGVGAAGQLGDPGRQRAARDVGQRHVL